MNLICLKNLLGHFILCKATKIIKRIIRKQEKVLKIVKQENFQMEVTLVLDMQILKFSHLPKNGYLIISIVVVLVSLIRSNKNSIGLFNKKV